MGRIPRAVWVGFLVVLSGCSRCDDARAKPNTPTNPPSVVLRVAYGSEKKTWLEEQARAFEATRPKTRSGKPIQVTARAMGSGEATQSLLDGSFPAQVYSPASQAYLTLLNDAWTRRHPGRVIAPSGEPLVLSPVVIALWKPMAEALGWPAKKLG